MRELTLKGVDKESRALEKEKGVWGSRGEKAELFFYIVLY